MTRSILTRTPSLLIFICCLALFTLFVTIGAYTGLISTSFVKTLGKTLCLCLAALAMDLVWGYAGILSLGHMAFFALGGAPAHGKIARGDRFSGARHVDVCTAIATPAREPVAGVAP